MCVRLVGRMSTVAPSLYGSQQLVFIIFHHTLSLCLPAPRPQSEKAHASSLSDWRCGLMAKTPMSTENPFCCSSQQELAASALKADRKRNHHRTSVGCHVTTNETRICRQLSEKTVALPTPDARYVDSKCTLLSRCMHRWMI